MSKGQNNGLYRIYIYQISRKNIHETLISHVKGSRAGVSGAPQLLIRTVECRVSSWMLFGAVEKNKEHRKRLGIRQTGPLLGHGGPYVTPFMQIKASVYSL